MGEIDAGTDPALMRALPSLDGPIPVLFCLAGAAVTTVGALPWIAVVTGAGGIGWAIRLLAAVAALVGVFVLLVGVGLFRARTALRTAAARTQSETALDAELTATLAEATAAHGNGNGNGNAGHEACHQDTACASCDASCALNSLRR